MTRAAILIGAALVAVGVWFFVATGSSDWLALVPAIAGVLIGVPGVIAALRPAWRREAMRASMFVAAVAASAATIKALVEFWPESPPSTASIVAQVLTSGLCLLFVAVGANAYVNARRPRST